MKSEVLEIHYLYVAQLAYLFIVVFFPFFSIFSWLDFGHISMYNNAVYHRICVHKYRLESRPHIQTW